MASRTNSSAKSGYDYSSLGWSAPSDKTIPIGDIKNELNGMNGNSNNPYDSDSPKKKVSKKKIIIYSVVALIGIIIGVACFLQYYKNYLLDQITIIETSEEEATFVDESGNVVNLSDYTSNTTLPTIEKEHISNFLLIGIDSRTSKYTKNGKGSRADVIMIMSVDHQAKTIKMMSVARDSYAYVPGYKNPRKINSAMTFGGADLLKVTLENHLRIKIDGYAFVNFEYMAKIIDACGGVRVNLTKAEAYNKGGINYHLKALYGKKAPLVDGYGKNYKLTGKQAVAYARIRYIGDGDYERQRRQMEVLRGLLKQFMDMSTTKKASVMDDVLSCIVTNVPKKDIENYAFKFLPSMNKTEVQYIQLPVEGCFNAGMYGKEWSMRPNWNALIPYVQQYFYGETKPFDPVKDIPKSPSLSKCKTNKSISSLLR